MKKENLHISKENFKRYLENKMSAQERNLFERKLQKNPFEREALEGFLNINPNQLQKDLSELKAKIYPNKHKNNYRYWAAAASFLLIITSGIIWLQLKEKSLLQEMAESKKELKQEEKIITPDFQNKINLEGESFKQQHQEENSGEKPFEKKKINKVAPQPKNTEKTLKSETVRPIKTSEKAVELSAKNVINKETNLEEAEIEPLQNKKTSHDILQPKDSNVLFAMEATTQEQKARTKTFETNLFQAARTAEDLSEVAAAAPVEEELTENKIIKSKAKRSSAILTDSKAQPEIGIPEFKVFLDNEAVLSADYPKRKEVVKLLVSINSSGEIIDIINLNKTGALIFEKAKLILSTGPNWLPEIKNGIPIDSKTKIKIVFKRKK